MSTRFGLALLLLCLVLLGLSDAQRQQQQRIQQRQGQYTQGHYVAGGNNGRRGPGRAIGRNTAGAIIGGGVPDAGQAGDVGGTTESPGANVGPGPGTNGLDCSKNQLASNNRDRFAKRT